MGGPKEGGQIGQKGGGGGEVKAHLRRCKTGDLRQLQRWWRMRSSVQESGPQGR